MNPQAVYLVQTDTTVGLLSQDPHRLATLKSRPSQKPILLALDSLSALKRFSRVPLLFRNLVRRSNKSSFVYPNGAGIRVVKEPRHRRFLERFGYLYSTSANPSGGVFSLEFGERACDIMVLDEAGLCEGQPSKIWRLGRSRRRKLRG